MQSPADNETGRMETSAGGELISFEGDTVQEPYEGMLFESEGAAKAFYDEYARRVGFVTRVLSSRKSERDGSIISRGLGCRGGSDNKKARHLQTQKRDRRREGCTAMILVKREKPGQWIVRKFVRDHNHPLVVQLQKSRPTLDEKDKKIQELTAELRVKKRLTSAYREQLLMFVKDVENHNEHLSKKVEVVVDNLKDLEAKRQELLQHR
ncbi:protein FAR-RED IMPAIRED RESPONSE 1-like [Vitis riparia]|uniref:protein FAR-RED IMPAIRED RESPONSE 1-like n=1 Tax=Vitis riparia TaxID=96939 RepID=UPI00155B083E|nr:protein FAR-RED IMPAIRED RESPONSE 1-like [Vitis riparia]XP_034685862.1 protein FAR-RED IMPAIRED RESPONSE 1-like [Vitis riparia]